MTIAAGGTAGHIVPALAVADALSARGAGVSFVGTRERAEAELVPAHGYEIDFLDVRGLDRRNPVKAAVALGRAAVAVRAAGGLLRARGTDVVMGGGGYVAGPVGVAAIRGGLPLILTEADSHLGITNRVLARRARRVCLAFALPDRTGERYRHTGRPVPRAILDADRAEARRELGIDPEARCLLIFGGSLGARSINEAAVEAFTGPGSQARSFHILHVSGSRDHATVEARTRTTPEYTLIEYLPDLGAVLAAADLVVARSGGSVFELAARGLPAILIPYPHATAAHQLANARWMADAGAAVVIADEQLGPKRLLDEATALLGSPDELERMAAAARSIAMPDAAERIATEILEAV